MKNLLGIYEKALPVNISWYERLQLAKELGFDFVELSIDEKDYRLERLYWNDDKIMELNKAIQETGITLNSMCFSGHRRFPLGSKDLKTRVKSLELMERAIKLAVKLGVRVIQLAGYDVYYEEQDEDTHNMFMQNLKKCTEMAAENQVMLAIEIMDTEYINSITKYMKIDKKINSPWLTVYPDTGNLSAWGNIVEEEIEKGYHKIVAVHLKDALRVTKTFKGKFKNVNFGDGCVDFVKIFKKLKELDYYGPFVIEMWSGENNNDPVDEIIKAKKFIMKKLAEGGFTC